MKELMIFSNPKFGEVRTIEEDGKVLFCGSDVAKTLGYKNSRKALADHCKGVTKRYTPTSSGRQEMNFIPEGDIYRLAAKSELPGADEFERWIFDEVLPSIRKNGGYIADQESMTPEELMAKALMVAQKTLADREARLSALTVDLEIAKPKADYFDELVDRNLLTNFRETAKQLQVPPKKFISFLLEKKYIYRDKRGKLGTQTMVTPKGRETFRLLFVA